jgi:hypothetical protein
MPDYQQGKIYKIYSHSNPDKIYIGSTCLRLCDRMRTHRYSYYNNQTKIATSHLIFEEFGVENCLIELLENYPCNSKDELNAREGHYIRTLNCVNKNITGRTRKEYNEDNKEKILEYKKEYYEKNREKLLEHKKEYDEKHKEVLKIKRKEYYEKNREKLLENKKEYDKQKWTCEVCNTTIKIGEKSSHLKTKKHLDKISS